MGRLTITVRSKCRTDRRFSRWLPGKGAFDIPARDLVAGRPDEWEGMEIC